MSLPPSEVLAEYARDLRGAGVLECEIEAAGLHVKLVLAPAAASPVNEPGEQKPVLTERQQLERDLFPET